MKNRDIALMFDRIAALLEIKGENKFKIIAYRRAAENISSLGKELGDLDDYDGLTDIPGIGKAIAAKIMELLSTGRLHFYEELITEVPESLLDLADIPELGPKRVRLLWEKLGITGVDQLERAAIRHDLLQLEGFGEKMEAKILSGIRKSKKHSLSGRIPLGKAWNEASDIIEALKRNEFITKVSAGGSLRRMKDMVGDIDILAVSCDADKAMKFFASMDVVDEVLVGGPTKTSVRTRSGIQVDLRVIKPDSWGTGLQYFTGSQEHNVRMRELAIDNGFSLSEYCLRSLSDGKETFFDTEEELYRFLGLTYIPPELRQGRGEIELARENMLPDLVEEGNIKGDLQCHTDRSDGAASLEEVAISAIGRGLDYFLVTDHSHGLGITGGVSSGDLVEQGKEIDSLNGKYGKAIRILKGVEVEVKADGTLDLDETTLASLDLVVAAVHTSLGQEREKITDRFLRAIENPYVHIFAHPTGRLVGERDGAAADWERVFRAAAASGTVLEINATPQRLDLPDNLIRLAKKYGCRFAIDSDAHDPRYIGSLFFGIGMARRAGLTGGDIVNTLPADELLSLFGK